MNGFSTKAIHSGYEPNDEDGAVIPPIHLTTTFRHGNLKEYEYSRSGNPTREVLERVLAELDGNTNGYAFSSGSAALAIVVSLLEKGKKMLFSSDVYGGTYRYVVQVASKAGAEYGIVDFTDEQAVEKALNGNDIGLVWLETPTNPLLKVTDMQWLADLAHNSGALFAVDNTFASPILQSPAEHGADLVVYSTTKYMNGHSDSVGGAITTSDKKLAEKIWFTQNAMGNMLSPFDSWLTLRGLKTLELRMNRHIENADAVLKVFQSHQAVSAVYYPGHGDSRQSNIVKKQMLHPGAMLSFELKDGLDPQEFIKALQHIPLAESLGGIESLLDHPASMTHASIPKEEREKIGLSDGLFRLSVGIENAEDLVTDITQALDEAGK